MIVPQYWAEGRVQHREKGRQVTMRRFGWSDTNQADAQTQADSRAQAALERFLSGEPLPRREPKIPYNGAQGVPIREEILSRHGEAIVTRNSYGARCLNTPNVFFADIDFESEPGARVTMVVFAVLFLGAVTMSKGHLSLPTIILEGLLTLFASYWIASWLFRIIRRAMGGAEQVAYNRIRAFVASHPGWNLRLYRTPAGLRLLALHQTFDPGDPVVAQCFRALRVDPIYARMCSNQQCFRARVSPKPWRIGIAAHLRPRPGVWPVKPERIPLRNRWIENYETVARHFAACSFVESIGSDAVHPEARRIQELHDEFCQAHSELPIA